MVTEKPRSNVKVLFQTLFSAGNGANLFVLLVSRRQGGVWYATNRRLAVQALRIKLTRRYWQENIHLRKKSHSYMLEAYEVTPVFILIYIM